MIEERRKTRVVYYGSNIYQSKRPVISALEKVFSELNWIQTSSRGSSQAGSQQGILIRRVMDAIFKDFNSIWISYDDD